MASGPHVNKGAMDLAQICLGTFRPKEKLAD
jgi:hypothetical protein